ncbi:TonB-dependent receptor [Sphingomonas sp. T1]|uniref:TonB-dependent receptor n=1 Tax=Sphingomonas aerolata TaxID=185951 RepID=A0A2T4YT18_9SPHN|nr:TonB-dependent receptor [Sphingomonas sp. PvP018]MBD8734576.1 TonB-dependent receptor [Sphingomonas sp. CFBP 13706]MBP2514864.1 TonB-dependent receptor [Sphingomonas sp. PvP018]PTM46958.1 TonB-dependent receptor [Sphingomonas aerolata]VXD06426.1 TonB-dependent receptor [Sphingomonas sp. T1]
MIIGLSHRARGPAVLRALLIGSAMIPLAIGIARAEPVDGPAAAAAPAPRGNASITGTISQAGSGDYLDGASVSIPALGLATAADRAGRFTLAGIPAGTHDVVVRYVGFPDARRSVTVTDAAVVLDVAMTIETSADGDEIVVSGSRPIAESEAAALQIQRTSPSLVSVIASDSIGRLPDQNVAQAVSRLPGVGVQRDQGQARYITLRGSPINWTTLSFDGINVVSPEGRDARFDSIPSAIASQIIVRKAVTPDMTGETIAGNVDIITRSAFDYPGLKVQAKGGLGHVELGKKTEYEGSLVVSDRFDTGIGEFGIVSSASLYRRGMVTDNFETDFEAVDRDLRPGYETRNWARETENKLYRLTRKNYSLSSRLDWRPAPGHKLFAETIYSAFEDDEQRNNYIFDLDDQQSRTPNGTAACAVNARPASGTTGYADVCTGNTPLLGTVYGIDLNSNFTVRKYKQSVFTNTLGGDHELGDWKVAWRGNYTRSIDDRSQPAQLNYDSPSFGTNGANAANRLTVGYDLTDPQLAKVQLYRTIRNADGSFSRGDRVTAIEDFPRTLSRLRSLKAQDVTEAYTAKLDISREASVFGASTILAAGVRYDDRTKTSNEYLLDLSTPAQFAAAGIATNYSAIAKPGGFQGEIPLGYTFQYFDRDKVLGLVDQAKAVGSYVRSDANFYDVGEKVYSAYAMATATTGWGSIIGGARVEHIRNDARAFSIGTVGTGSAATTVTTPIDVKSSQTLVYPSLHLNWDVDDRMKARLSFNTGAARPDYDQLRPNLSYNDANATISGGNPDAKPEKAKGVDLYVEYYTMPRGFLSIGAYYKDVTDVLFDSTQTFGRTTLNTGGVDRSGYLYSTIVNGGSGYIMGIEGAIQQQLEPFTADLGLPEWMGGFGVQLNATINKSRAETPGTAALPSRKVPLPGASDAIYNLIAYYEKYGFSARVSYQNRSAWLDAIGGTDTIGGVVRGIDGGDFYWAKDNELDASVRYAINNNVEIYGDFANLLNGPGRRYAGSSAYTIEHETFGRRYTGGVRVTF